MGLFDSLADALGLGGDVSIDSPSPTGFTSAGLTAMPDASGNVSVNRSAGMQSILDSIRSQAAKTGSEFAGLRSQLTPGFGKLTQSAVTALENKRRSSIGNLRENLSRRRVLGSSFAADAISRSKAEFADKEAKIRAETGLAELGATIDLIQKESTARLQGFNAIVQQNNFESALGANMAASISELLNSNAQLEAQLQAQSDAGVGEFLGTAATLALFA